MLATVHFVITSQTFHAPNSHTISGRFNRPFSSCFEPHYESEAKCKAFQLKISFLPYMLTKIFRENFP